MGIEPSNSDVVKLGEHLLVVFRKLADIGDGANLLRPETSRIGESQLGCYVIEVREQPRRTRHTVWVDTGLFRIRRLDTGQVQSVGGKPANVIMRMSFSTVSRNEPLPDRVFSFVPPAGARLVDELP